MDENLCLINANTPVKAKIMGLKDIFSDVSLID